MSRLETLLNAGPLLGEAGTPVLTHYRQAALNLLATLPPTKRARKSQPCPHLLRNSSCQGRPEASRWPVTAPPPPPPPARASRALSSSTPPAGRPPATSLKVKQAEPCPENAPQYPACVRAASVTRRPAGPASLQPCQGLAAPPQQPLSLPAALEAGGAGRLLSPCSPGKRPHCLPPPQPPPGSETPALRAPRSPGLTALTCSRTSSRKANARGRRQARAAGQSAIQPVPSPPGPTWWPPPPPGPSHAQALASRSQCCSDCLLRGPRLGTRGPRVGVRAGGRAGKTLPTSGASHRAGSPERPRGPSTLTVKRHRPPARAQHNRQVFLPPFYR